MAVSERTRKIVWVTSGGRCAICKRSVLTQGTETDDPSIFGEEAHIVARSAGGPRAGGLDPAELDSHANLILLCSPHHKQIDDQPTTFTAERLRQIKEEHEAWVASLAERGQHADEMKQADRVSAWPSVVRRDPADPTSAPAWGAQVRNASALPIYQVHVEFAPIHRGRGAAAVVIEVLPPGDWLVSGRRIYPRPEQSTMRADVWDLPERVFVVGLRITDAAERTWQRNAHGVLSRVL